jgi:capsular exopolysaccharide synthesis family protein
MGGRSIVSSFRELLLVIGGVVVTLIFEAPISDFLAWVGIDPKKLGIWPIAIISGLVGFAIGVLTTTKLQTSPAIKEFGQNRRLRNLLSYEEEFGLPFVGWTPDIEDEDPVALLADPKSALSESFTSIADAATFQFREDDGIFMVTSFKPADGKSTLCAGIAHALARRGKRVLVVDADFRRPQQPRLFKQPRSHGVTNCVASQGRVEAFVQETSYRSIWLLQAGTIPPSPDEIWSHAAETRLWETLREQFDYVIVDAPPVMGIADAPALARSIRNVIFVVRHRQVHKTQADLALRRLQLAAGDLRIVMAGTALRTSSYGYGYGYGYGYEAEHDGREND